MTHLTPDELIDAVDRGLSPERRAHLDTCDQCRLEATRLRSIIAEVRDADMPEPSPWFWDHFSARVRTAIADELSAAPQRRWFDWPVLVPIAGLALIVLALVSSLTSEVTTPQPQPVAIVASADTDSDADTEMQWQVVADLVGDVDLDAAHELGISTAPGTADSAILRLTVVEQQELMRLLREELKAGG